MSHETNRLRKRYTQALAVVLTAASMLLFGAVGKARAADCMSFPACAAQADAQRADAQQRRTEATLYSIAASNSAAKGDGSAAAMYFVAAKQRNDQAALLEIAAANNDQRARFFFALSVPSEGSLSEQVIDSQGADDGPDAVAAGAGSAHEYCKNAANKDYSEYGIHILVRPGTWCHKGDEVTRVDYSASNDVTGPQALDVHPNGCDPVERSWYRYHGRGGKSGRKLTQNCNFKSVPGLATMHCSVSLYFHSDGSRYYQKKMHCHVSFL